MGDIMALPLPPPIVTRNLQGGASFIRIRQGFERI